MGPARISTQTSQPCRDLLHLEDLLCLPDRTRHCEHQVQKSTRCEPLCVLGNQAKSPQSRAKHQSLSPKGQARPQPWHGALWAPETDLREGLSRNSPHLLRVPTLVLHLNKLEDQHQHSGIVTHDDLLCPGIANSMEMYQEIRGTLTSTAMLAHQCYRCLLLPALSILPHTRTYHPQTSIPLGMSGHQSLITQLPSPSPRKVSKQELANDIETADDSGEGSERRNFSNNLPTRSTVVRPPARPQKPSKANTEVGDRSRRRSRKTQQTSVSSTSDDDTNRSGPKPRRVKAKETPVEADSGEETSDISESEKSPDDLTEWKNKKKQILKTLPPGVDSAAAKQILNDIVVQGDEVHWNDVAGLDIAKNALRETVVYPFLRPDLFMGLREPARGMLLFGPPGTGKTMLARAVATESKSTFFSISASSLTSKYLGESEKLVRALFGLARTLAPSIIFVDEIDSLLSQRSGSGEHEATMRIKTEFLIQWSDLQRAAAGRETTEKDKERGDANRVLVLAATNLPWAIDEAARRRFVRRRQYIPLPEPTTRETQLRTLLGQQKHDLSNEDILKLVGMTDGFSGSDITALAKDAAMGPLRSLGEALLHMTMDEIRPIQLLDFEASLTNIRPSVSKTGLKEYEDWAQEFGERGG
ncbi:hypothetical protein NXS19_013281 [Fusarium pseudograminearum]|nr:hypothetical protein NXS19_013281 [Fusarium pseudograminearum]